MNVKMSKNECKQGEKSKFFKVAHRKLNFEPNKHFIVATVATIQKCISMGLIHDAQPKIR